MQEEDDLISTNEEQEYIKRKRIKARYSIRYFSAYAHYRTRRKWPQYTREDIHRAIVMYYNLAQEDLAKGHKITFLNKMGGLYLTKEERGVTYDPETDRIINTLPINIYASIEMWKEKPELKNKTFVRYTNEHSDGFLFKLHFQTSKAIFKNKLVYSFKFNRTLKKKLVKNIRDKKVDAYLIPKRDE
jgi:hypothetical protein